MEELALPLLKFLRYLVIELVCDRLLYWAGRGTLWILTFGRYPDEREAEEHEGRIVLVGGLVVLVIFVLAIHLP